MSHTDQKISLALGSGGSRGLAHIGVIKVLHEAGIAIHSIAGASIGAWVGGLYAIQKNISEVESVALSAGWKQIAKILLDPSFKGGLVHGNKMLDHLHTQFGKVHFNNLHLPFAAVATNLATGEAESIQSGEVAKAVLASMAVPFIFKPVKIGPKTYVDGGLSEPVPVTAAFKMGAEIVIAVNLDGSQLLSSPGSFTSPLNVLGHSFNIFRKNLGRQTAAPAQIVIEPDSGIKSVVGWEGFLQSKKIIRAGESAMKKALPKLRELLNTY